MKMYEYNNILFNMTKFKLFRIYDSPNAYAIVGVYEDGSPQIFLYNNKNIRDFIYRKLKEI